MTRAVGRGISPIVRVHWESRPNFRPGLLRRSSRGGPIEDSLNPSKPAHMTRAEGPEAENFGALFLWVSLLFVRGLRFVDCVADVVRFDHQHAAVFELLRVDELLNALDLLIVELVDCDGQRHHFWLAHRQ